MEFKLLKECVKLYDSLHQTPKYIEKGFSMVRVKDLKEGFLDIKNPVFVSEEDYLKFTKKYKPQKGDIIFSRVGSYGISSYINFEKNFCLGQNTVLIHPIDIDNKYLYYLFTSPIIKRQIEEKVTGSTQKTISLKSINEFSIPIPTLKHQRKIGETLFNIDLKIETNKKLISLLEDISQNLFKHWFIDFEFPNEEGKPYKSSGGEMVESELGEIPKGWFIDNLSNIADIVMGQSPKSDTYNNDNIGLPLLNGAADFKNCNLSPNKYTSDAKKVGHKGDFVFGVRATIGLVTELDDTYAIGRGAGIAKSLTKEAKEYLYGVLNKAFNEFQYTASGSVYLNISKNDLKDYKICRPSNNIIKKYHSAIKAIMIQKENLIQEDKNLTQLRDTLLPKLLSGEIEIPDDLEV